MQKNNRKKRNNKGFSMVELIIVIAIMAALVGILAPQYIKYVEKSKVSADLQNADKLLNAVKVAATEDLVNVAYTATFDTTGVYGSTDATTTKLATILGGTAAGTPLKLDDYKVKGKTVTAYTVQVTWAGDEPTFVQSW